MKWILLTFLSFGILHCAYTDPEIEMLWDSLSNIYDPTFEDYKMIESYLQNGERPILQNYSKTSTLYGCSDKDLTPRINQRRNFKLVGPNGEMPIFELHQFNVTEKTKDRCILIYASFNHPYPQKAHRLIGELKECGYSGNALIRIGGFPNLSEGGIKFCPYLGVWKNEFIVEALRMGFTKILHLDTSVHPLTDLNTVFETIDSKGYYLLRSNTPTPYIYNHQHLEYLKIIPGTSRDVPWLPGYILGFNFTNEPAAALFRDFDFASKDFENFYCYGSEEMIMTILAWNHNLAPTGYYYDHVLETNERPDASKITHLVEFYIDFIRN